MIQKLYMVWFFCLGSYFFLSPFFHLLLYIVHSSLSASVFCSLPIHFLWLSSSFLVKLFCWLEEEIGTGCPRLVICAVLCSKNSIKKIRKWEKALEIYLLVKKDIFSISPQ